MANFQLQPVLKKKWKSAPAIDMTPMVDLGFLLITFFIFTATISKQVAASIIMPADGAPSTLAASQSLTVMLTKENKIYLYEGNFRDALEQNKIIETNYDVKNGLGHQIRLKQQIMDQQKISKDTLMLLIKPTNEATYENIIAAFDEVAINKVKRYAIAYLLKEEEEFIKQRN